MARCTKKLKMKLFGGGPKFARFAKSGDKISNLATLDAATALHLCNPPPEHLHLSFFLLRNDMREPWLHH